MKKLSLLKTVLLLCALIVGSETMWATDPVASATPVDGKSYVVAAYINSKYYALPNTVGTGTIEGVEIALNRDNKVSTPIAEGKTWTLEEGTGDNAGKYYIKYTSGKDTYCLYKSGTAAGNYNFAVNKSNKTLWSFSTNGTGYTVTATDRGTTNNVLIQCNGGTFRCFSEASSIILLEVGNAEGQVVVPTFDPAGGKKTEAQNVTINCITEGATIYYTTDGTNPTTNSSVYTSAIPVTKTTTIKAMAVKAGLDNSDVNTATYTIVYDETSLPFAFNGGRDDIVNTSGLSQTGLGTDYGTTNTKLKFDSANDELVLKIDETPGELTFYVKSNSFSGGTFKVQESANGSSYSDVASYSDTQITGSSEIPMTISTLNSSTRYIKWIYSKKSGGNVGMGNIKLNPKTVSGTISTTGWNSFSCDCPLDLSSITGGKAYYAKETEGTKVTLTSTDASVPAGEGLMIMGTPGGSFTINVAASGTAIDGNLLKGLPNGGTVAVSSGSTYNYVFAWATADPENTYGFYLVNSNAATLGAGKAYLQTTTSSSRLAISFEDDEVTGIVDVKSNKEDVTSNCFNLAGQRVNANHKGIVIINGKKHFNK